MGGINTVYLTTFFGVAGSTFGLTSSTALVKPLVSRVGATSLFTSTLTRAGPAGFGLMLGIASFGNGKELSNLIRNALTYKTEFKSV